MLVEWGLLGVRWHSDVAICKGPSRNILMPLEVEQVWTSVWHTQRKSPEVRLGGIQTLGLSLVSLVRIYDLFIVAAWNKLEDVDGLPLITASITRLPFIHVRSVGNQTAYSEDDKLTPLHQERLQDGRNQSGPRGTAMPSFGKPMKTNEHHGKHGLPSRWWVMWVWQPLYTLFVLMNSEFGVFEHVLVKTTELPCWLNEVCKAHSDHIATLLNEKELHNIYWSNWKSTSLNICLKIVWKTFAKKESWSEPWRYQNTFFMIVGVIGTGLQSPRTNNFTHLRVEQVGGWPRTTLPWITASTMHFRCHWVMLQCCKPQRSKAACSEDDNVNSVAPETSSEVKGPKADVGGTKADQEELQCHHAENHWKPLKTMEKHALPRTW